MGLASDPTTPLLKDNINVSKLNSNLLDRAFRSSIPLILLWKVLVDQQEELAIRKSILLHLSLRLCRSFNRQLPDQEVRGHNHLLLPLDADSPLRKTITPRLSKLE
jgi:hypothetical protein